MLDLHSLNKPHNKHHNNHHNNLQITLNKPLIVKIEVNQWFNSSSMCLLNLQIKREVVSPKVNQILNFYR